MALNPQFMISPNLQEFFIDKTTGLPLTEGIVTFYSDVNRTQLKNVYQLTGYPNYSYTELPNPLILSDVGTVINNSDNDVRIYYYPYDDNGNVELYYITVESSDLTLQLVREAWPNFIPNNPDSISSDEFNYIPNGQFRSHYDVQGDPENNIPFGQITQPTTILAPGGWTFERPDTSTATDNVTFFRYGNYVANPSASPRYAVQVSCQGANPSDAFKNLCVKFPDVNKFASDSQDYSIGFNGVTSSSADFDVTLYVIKNFGTGGSPSAPVIVQEAVFTITSTAQFFSVPVIFGDNSAYSLGDNNDDYVQLAFGFPTDQTFTGIFTDFVQVFGNQVVDSFPTQTDADMYARGIAGWMPQTKSDGSDLYLPLMRTPSGVDVDYGAIGEVDAVAYSALPVSRLFCDGAAYLTSGYSADGIPYRRLFNKLMTAAPTNIPPFGTGYNFVTVLATQPGAGANLLLATNKLGAQTATADGAVPTGFTFGSVCPGNTSYGFMGFFGSNDSGFPVTWIVTTDKGIVDNDTDAGTSPFTVNIYRTGQPNTTQIAQVIVNSFPAAGDYINIGTFSAQYYMWFKVDGVGVDPAPGGIGIEVDVSSSFSIDDLGIIIAQAASSFQVSTIAPAAGSFITPNSYFTLHANSQLYVVWMSLNGTGTQPVVPGAIYIPVPYLSTDSNTDIGSKIEVAINQFYYAVPDLRGAFVRGLDTGSGFDPDVLTRYALNYENCGAHIGSIEFDQIYEHYHQFVTSEVPSGHYAINTSTDRGDTPDDSFTLATGGTESRPINVALNYVIRY